MARKKEMTEEEAQKEVSIWLGDAQQNIEDSVVAFTSQWIPWPHFDLGVEVMDVARLRDVIGVRASDDYGDPWPTVERLLLDNGFRWSSLGGQRVMFVKENNNFTPDTGWVPAENA